MKAELDPAVGAGGVGGMEGTGMSGALDHLLGCLRGGLRGGSGGGGSEVLHEVQAAIPHDVVLTHDGKLLFAYAVDQEAIVATRRALGRGAGGTTPPVRREAPRDPSPPRQVDRGAHLSRVPGLLRDRGRHLGTTPEQIERLPNVGLASSALATQAPGSVGPTPTPPCSRRQRFYLNTLRETIRSRTATSGPRSSSQASFSKTTACHSTTLCRTPTCQSSSGSRQVKPITKKSLHGYQNAQRRHRPRAEQRGSGRTYLAETDVVD
jgi:hypothetical protein